MFHRRAPRRPSPTALAVSCLAGLSLSAAVLILLVPTLFRPDGQVHPLVLVGLAALGVVFAVGARHWRSRAEETG